MFALHNHELIPTPITDLRILKSVILLTMGKVLIHPQRRFVGFRFGRYKGSRTNIKEWRAALKVLRTQLKPMGFELVKAASHEWWWEVRPIGWKEVWL